MNQLLNELVLIYDSEVPSEDIHKKLVLLICTLMYQRNESIKADRDNYCPDESIKRQDDILLNMLKDEY